MNITQNYFQMFGLEPAFDLNDDSLAELSSKYRELQKEVHPDRFANAPEQERRVSVQYAAIINEAYSVLMSPLKRARYVLELKGVAFNEQNITIDEPTFLMEQVELRESLANVRGQTEPESELLALAEQVEQKIQQLNRAFALDYQQGNLDSAKKSVLKMQFMDKISKEIDMLEEELFD